MLSITDLPLLIIDNILDQVTKINRMSGRKFFLRHSQLLAVCPIWRAILLPKLYQKAYAMWIPAAKGIELDTNLDLITSNQCSAYVKQINIDLRSLECLALLLHRYKNWFRFNESNWNNITTLRISMRYTTLPIPQLLYVEKIKNCPGLSFLEFAECIVQYIPNIQHIYLKFSDDSNTSTAVYSKFINAYSHNLTSLSGVYISSFTDSTYLPNLTMLYLDLCADVSIILPKINPKQLKDLELKNVPLDFTWSAFYDISNGTKNNIVFDNLEKLMLVFTTDVLEDEPQLPPNIISESESVIYDVHFPFLKYIILENDFEFLSRHNYKFPERLRSMSIYNSIGGLKILDKLRIQSINGLRITQPSFDSTNEAEFYSLTNNCLGLYGKNSNVKFNLKVPHFTISWNQTRWNTLKQLELKTSNIYSFLQALTHCTMLESTTVHEVLFNDFSSDAYNIPTHTALKRLRFTRIRLDGCLEDDANKYIRHLLAHLSKLVSFMVCGAEWLDLYDFTRLLGNYYPHLKQLKIKQTGI